MLGISWVAAQLAASKEGLSSTKLVIGINLKKWEDDDQWRVGNDLENDGSGLFTVMSLYPPGNFEENLNLEGWQPDQGSDRVPAEYKSWVLQLQHFK
jgi:hypothetical protein